MKQIHLADITDTDDSLEEAFFRKTVLYVLIENVVVGLILHFNDVKQFTDFF